MVKNDMFLQPMAFLAFWVQHFCNICVTLAANFTRTLSIKMHQLVIKASLQTNTRTQRLGATLCRVLHKAFSKQGIWIDHKAMS